MKPPANPETFSLFGEPLNKSPILLWLPTDPEKYREKLQALENEYKKTLYEYEKERENPEKGS